MTVEVWANLIVGIVAGIGIIGTVVVVVLAIIADNREAAKTWPGPAGRYISNEE